MGSARRDSEAQLPIPNPLNTTSGKIDVESYLIKETLLKVDFFLFFWYYNIYPLSRQPPR